MIFIFFISSDHCFFSFRTGWLCSAAQLLSPALSSGSTDLHSLPPCFILLQNKVHRHVTICKIWTSQSTHIFIPCIGSSLVENGHKIKALLIWHNLIPTSYSSVSSQLVQSKTNSGIISTDTFLQNKVLSACHTPCLINVHIQYKSGWSLKELSSSN